MKKIMIAAAMVCVAVAVQASSVDWSFSEQVMKAKYSQAMNLTSCTAYLITEAAWSGFTSLAADKQTYKAFTSVAKADSQSITITSGDFSTSSTSKYGASGSAEVASGNFHVVLASESAGFYASVAYEGTSYDHSASPAPSHKDPSLSIAMAKAPLSASSFTAFATDIPEPTSGLLLLVGLVGMSLKRKRA